MVTVRQAAEELKVSKAHVRRMIRLGRWPFYKLSDRGVRLELDEIKALGRLRAEGERKRE